MASCSSLFFVLFVFCFYSGVIPSFIEMACESTTKAQFNHQSMLMCTVRPKQTIESLDIILVVWRKTGLDDPVAVVDGRSGNVEYKGLQGYGLADRSLNTMNVSLLISNTKLQHEGEYKCEVTTDSGIATHTTMLEVTAKYNTPTVRSIDRNDIPNAHKTLICEASGGYPKGQLRWFDENKTEWTKSANLTENKRNDGLVELFSELPLLTGSTFSEYTCVVYNASYGKEGSASIVLNNPSPLSEIKTPGSAVIAPVVVIGSLIVGLLMALLFFRRRSQRTHHEVSASDPDVDQSTIGGVNGKDSMA
ncbi:hypothetical protein CHARACLAT_015612 [Characodon lateralis]|uniref:Ig-like domain-containing protein n=1 Tax=Characodon lateralis TaxID=208331 RepID=A0ABU7EAM8_9TELE|nr:hypothetical protein [Characodon lateralis]